MIIERAKSLLVDVRHDGKRDISKPPIDRKEIRAAIAVALKASGRKFVEIEFDDGHSAARRRVLEVSRVMAIPGEDR